MLKPLTDRVAELAAGRAAARRQAIAASISIPGVKAFVEKDDVVLEGRAIGRRFALDPALRWRSMEVRHDQ